ncbi:MAG: hypothetical protein IT200_17060 [Thermoleophilia bacterium]|nr:hypothetical protein [Thermoleophilia bacterium]
MTLLVCSTLALAAWLAADLAVCAVARLLRRPPLPLGRGLRKRAGRRVYGARSVYDQRREVSWTERN